MPSLEDLEQKKERRRLYRAINREKIRAWDRLYYEANKEKICARRRGYREKKRAQQQVDKKKKLAQQQNSQVPVQEHFAYTPEYVADDMEYLRWLTDQQRHTPIEFQPTPTAVVREPKHVIPITFSRSMR
jgi:hypothetical protein